MLFNARRNPGYFYVQRREVSKWLTEFENSFFVNKTPGTLEALITLALRVLFMLEEKKQNEEMNKTVLFIMRWRDAEKGRGVLFILR